MKKKHNFELSPFFRLLQFEHNAFHVKRHLASMMKHITIKKIFNLISVELQRRLKMPVVKGYPPFLKVEPTNICNLNCPNCFTGSGADIRKKGKMDFELYKRVMDEIGDYLVKINLYFWGEPFLHSRLIDMIRYASDKNIGTCVSTNFLVFSEKMAVDILTSGLDHLIICLDGIDKKTYESYRKGGDFEKFMKNMETLSKVRKEKGLYSTIIDVQFLVFDYNRDQINEAEKFIKPFGFDRFTPKMDAEQKEAYNPDIFRSDVPCYWLWHVPTLNWDGTVTTCCDMPPVNFGDLKTNTFMNIWNGEKYVKARRLYKYDDPSKSKIVCAFCHRGPNDEYKRKLAESDYHGARTSLMSEEKPWED